LKENEVKTKRNINRFIHDLLKKQKSEGCVCVCVCVCVCDNYFHGKMDF